MKKIITVLVLFPLLSIILFAQEDESLINVQGTSVMSVPPTEIGIRVNIESLKDSYTEAIKDLTMRINTLNNELKKNGIKTEEKFTSAFQISKNTEWVNGKQIIKGYRALQIVNIRFALDMERLVKIINTITKSEANPEISVNFYLDEKTKKIKKDELIRLAVKDAKHKAELITNESGYKIQSIKEIMYGTENAGIYNNTDNLRSMKLSEISTEDIGTPSNIIMSDDVKIIYRIVSDD